jgi:hypothetical protein
VGTCEGSLVPRRAAAKLRSVTLVVRSRTLRLVPRSLVLVFAPVLVAACAGKSQSAGGAGGRGAAAGAAGAAGASGGTTPGGGAGGTSGGAGRGGGGSSGSSAGGGTGGTGGSVGGAGVGGAAGESNGGAGADTGGAGSGGNAGASGTAGLAGAAGSGFPECESSDDCTLVSDCCGCRAEPRDGQGFCALPCVRDACAEEAVAPSEVACVQGRCVIGRRCDGSAGCPASPPVCPEGTVASVVDDCWGACLPPTECGWVSGCEVCGDAFCVEFQAQRSSFTCVTRVDECDRDNYCECLGVCGQCSEADDAVACPCLVC